MSCYSDKMNVPRSRSGFLIKAIGQVNNVSKADDGPLAVFPEEVWELIINQIIRSQDIFNFFKAFPELDKIFHTKKANLLLELVLPHIMTKYLVRKKKCHGKHYWYLRSKPLFDLRLVCKRWKRAVEFCVQNHSDRYSTLPKSQDDKILTTSDNIIPDHHFSYVRMHKYHLGATIFKTTEQIETFMEEMEGCHGNPFPGKYVYCNVISASPLYFPQLVLMLRKFGKFVDVLDFNIYNNIDCNLINFKTILKGLSYVSNLKSLKIHGKLNTKNDKTTHLFFDLPESQNLFPPLPLLKTFDWQVCTENTESSWINRMMDTYVKQNNNLQKLAIDVFYCDNKLLRNLEKLCELHLYLDNNKVYTGSSIRNVLSLFPLGQLKKLCLSGIPDIGNFEIDITELLEIIGIFNIQSVIFEGILLKDLCKGKYQLEQTLESIQNCSSITSLWFDDNRHLSLMFLKMLPNLRFLHIYSDDYDSYGQLERDTFTNNLCSHYSQAGYIGENLEIVIPEKFSIWEELPKLEIMSASIHHTCGILDVQYAREYGNRPFLGYRP